jgi:hypothetical protein
MTKKRGCCQAGRLFLLATASFFVHCDSLRFYAGIALRNYTSVGFFTTVCERHREVFRHDTL